MWSNRADRMLLLHPTYPFPTDCIISPGSRDSGNRQVGAGGVSNRTVARMCNAPGYNDRQCAKSINFAFMACCIPGFPNKTFTMPTTADPAALQPAAGARRHLGLYNRQQQDNIKYKSSYKKTHTRNVASGSNPTTPGSTDDLPKSMIRMPDPKVSDCLDFEIKLIEYNSFSPGSYLWDAEIESIS
jgi:hypothetical protein